MATSHSADAFVGVELKATSTYIATAGTNPPIFHVLGRDLVALGGGTRRTRTVTWEALRDPFFLTVTDLNTGIATRQILMAENADYLNSRIVMDDTGIHLTVSRIVPSFATVDFNSEMPWVLNPYSYHFRLDGSGLSLGSIFARRLDSHDHRRHHHDLAFAPGGMPFDAVAVQPDASVFTMGHTYSFDVGAGGGVYEVASVPEPPALSVDTPRPGIRRRPRGPLRQGVEGVIDRNPSGSCTLSSPPAEAEQDGNAAPHDQACHDLPEQRLPMAGRNEISPVTLAGTEARPLDDRLGRFTPTE